MLKVLPKVFVCVAVGSVAFVAENYFLLGNSSWGVGGVVRRHGGQG
jgi:hypothetical protein